MSVDSQTGLVTDEALSYEIIERVAALKDVPISELAPLYTVIDPDALENMFTGPSQEGAITFHYEGCTVQVDSDDQVAIFKSPDE